MAPTVSSTYTQGSRFTGDLVIDKPAGSASGDDLFIHISSNITSAWTAPAGWTLLRSDYTGPASEVWHRRLDGTEGSTFTFTHGSGGNTLGACVRVSGGRTTSPVGASSVKFNTSSTTATGTDLTPDMNDSLVLFFVTADNNPTISGYTNPTAPPTYTELYEINYASDPTMSLAYGSRSVVSALGAPTATLSGANANIVTMVIVAPPSVTFAHTALSAAATLTDPVFVAVQSFVHTALSGLATIGTPTFASALQKFTNRVKSAVASFTNRAKSS